MVGYGWSRILFRDAMVLLAVALFTFTAVDGGDSPLPPPACSNAGWQEIVPFFLVLSAAIALIEGLNWLSWFMSRNLPIRGVFIRSQTQPEPTTGVDLLVPDGWIGAVLGFGLLFLTYRLHGPSPCKPNLGNPRVYLAGAFTLGYGLLVLAEVGLNVAWRIRYWIDDRKQRQG
jgi:hypothetical protein